MKKAVLKVSSRTRNEMPTYCCLFAGSGLFSPSDCSNLTDGNYTMSACGHQFLVCSSGLPHVMDCPANLVYNAEFNMCDWPYNVVGCEGSGGETTSGEPVPEESGRKI